MLLLTGDLHGSSEFPPGGSDRTYEDQRSNGQMSVAGSPPHTRSMLLVLIRVYARWRVHAARATGGRRESTAFDGVAVEQTAAVADLR